MNIQGQHTFAVPRADLWRALMDPSTLAATLPGCDGLVADGKGRFRGGLTVKIGPVQGRFAGAVQMADLVEPERFDVRVHGEGPAGFLNGEGQVRLDAAAGGTTLHYALAVHVGGRVAAVGQRLLDSTARAITRQALDGLARQVEAVTAPSSAAPEAPAAASAPAAFDASHTAVAPPHLKVRPETDPGRPTTEPVRPTTGRERAPAPTTTGFAVGVARHVFDDLVPPSRRRWLLAGLATIIVLWIVWECAL